MRHYTERETMGRSMKTNQSQHKDPRRVSEVFRDLLAQPGHQQNVASCVNLTDSSWSPAQLLTHEILSDKLIVV